MGDLVEDLKKVGDVGGSIVRGLKNLAAPESPGATGLPSQPGPGGIKYNKDGAAPTPVKPEEGEDKAAIAADRAEFKQSEPEVAGLKTIKVDDSITKKSF